MSNTERNSRGPIKLTPDMAGQMLRAGELTRIIAPTVPPLPDLEATIGDLMIDRAKQLFGKDFLGPSAIKVMEQQCQQAGINVVFELPGIPFPFRECDFITKKVVDEESGKDRFMSLHPTEMILDGVRMSVNIRNLISLFKDVNPFGDGRIFRTGKGHDWHRHEDFMRQRPDPGYTMPTKEVVPKSLGRSWRLQDNLIESNERRRRAVEVVWDLILYYANTQQRLLQGTGDWSNDKSSSGSDQITVGSFTEEGMIVNGVYMGEGYTDLGVCPTVFKSLS